MFSGVKFIFRNSIKQFIPKECEENVLAKVELTDGQILPADIAIIGIGSTFYTDWMKTSSVTMRDDGTIPVNKVTFENTVLFLEYTSYWIIEYQSNHSI